MKKMKTHEVEQKLGITKQALIYYEKEGLIKPSRDQNNYRHYTQNDIELLQVILLLRSFDLPIDEIKMILSGELSLRKALETKQNYLLNERERIIAIEKRIKEYTKRIKVHLASKQDKQSDNDQNYPILEYNDERLVYENQIIFTQDIQSIDLSVCCSKGENRYYYLFYNLYCIYLDINTLKDTYSFQIMNTNAIYHFFDYLESLNIGINDPLELMQLFKEKKDLRDIQHYFNRHFFKWKDQYNLEVVGGFYTVIQETYMKPLQNLKPEDVPSAKEQVKEFFEELQKTIKKLKGLFK